MAETYKHLHQGLVSNAASPGTGGAVTYTATDVTTIIRHMRVVNIHSAAVELTLWHMPPTGDRLFAKAETASTLYLNIYGLELT